MAITLVSTVAGETSNSYADVAYADTYWASHYSSVKASQWAVLTTPKKTLALINACRIIERIKFTEEFRWTMDTYFEPTHNGMVRLFTAGNTVVRSNLDQNLQFPRNVDYTSAGVLYIPDEVKDAQCEQAVHLLTVDDAAIASQLQGVVSDSVRAGSVSASQTFSGVGSVVAPMAYEILIPFILKSNKIRRG